jgi:cytochrome c6
MLCLQRLAQLIPPALLSQPGKQSNSTYIDLHKRRIPLRELLSRKLLSIVLLAVTLLTFAFGRPAMAADISSGAKVFSGNCAACHAGGNNVVMANKTLKKEALEQFGMNSADAIVYQVQHGKNAMPAFAGRLSDEQIQDVAAYVLDQSSKDWKA